MFNASVITLKAPGRAGACAELRKLYDLFDACALGSIDEVALTLLGVNRGRHQQKELTYAVQGAGKSVRSSEVALDQFNSRKRDGPGARAVTNKGANGQAPIKKLS